jgi:hypothetical protein
MKDKFNQALLSLGIPQNLVDIMWAEMGMENPSEHEQILASNWGEKDYLWEHTAHAMGWVIAEYIGYAEMMFFLDKVGESLIKIKS